MTDAIVAEPAIEPVDCRKISMNGRPVGDSMAVDKSTMLNRVAMSIDNPRLPLMMRVRIIERGTVMDGFWISSDICFKLIDCSIESRQIEQDVHDMHHQVLSI